MQEPTTILHSLHTKYHHHHTLSNSNKLISFCVCATILKLKSVIHGYTSFCSISLRRISTLKRFSEAAASRKLAREASTSTTTGFTFFFGGGSSAFSFFCVHLPPTLRLRHLGGQAFRPLSFVLLSSCAH